MKSSFLHALLNVIVACTFSDAAFSVQSFGSSGGMSTFPQPLSTIRAFKCPILDKISMRRSTSFHLAAGTVEEMKGDILTAIGPTKRGVLASPEQKIAIESKIQLLESECPLAAPARDPRMAGAWTVLYTTAPPPSNGVLGPFTGVAKQNIDLLCGGYQNILQVGENKWLSAVLDAKWEEWDGSLLTEENERGSKKWKEGVVERSEDDIHDDEDTLKNSQSNIEAPKPRDGLLSLFRGQGEKKLGTNSKAESDYGATSWKVDFKTITLSLFGKTFFQQKFPENTARVWKMTYLDNDTRIVRAGRTGKAEDDVVFYMVRDDGE